MLTFENIVRSVALQFGHVPTADEVEWVLWERTGFPSFFMGDPAQECAEQVFRHYQLAQYGLQPCWCCGRGSKHSVCEPCDSLRLMDEDRGSYMGVLSGNSALSGRKGDGLG